MTNNQRKSFSDIVSNKKQEEKLQNQKQEGKEISKNANSKLMTFKLSESRWMALKLRSLEEKRPVCDIIIEAIKKDYRSKGLDW